MDKIKEKNELSIFMNHLRKTNNDTMNKMAIKLNADKSNISNIENGKRKIPDNYAQKINEIYHLSKSDYIKLKEIVNRSRGFVKIDMKELSPAQEDLLLYVENEISSLSNETISKIMKLL